MPKLTSRHWSEGLLLGLVDFRIGDKVSCQMPLTITTRLGSDMELGRCTVKISQIKKIVRFRWRVYEGRLYVQLVMIAILCVYRRFKVPYREERLIT
jgi:hypothetical protein